MKEQVKQLNAKIDAERRERKQEQKRLNSRPQCPYCGNRLEGQFELCNACSKPIIWVHGKVGKPGTEAILKAEWQKEQERSRADAAQRRVQEIAQHKVAQQQRARLELDNLRTKAEKDTFTFFCVTLLGTGFAGAWFGDQFDSYIIGTSAGTATLLFCLAVIRLKVRRYKEAAEKLEKAVDDRA